MKTLWACGRCRNFTLWRDAAVEINDAENVVTYDNVACGACSYEGSQYYKFEAPDDFDIPDDNKLPLDITANLELEYL